MCMYYLPMCTQMYVCIHLCVWYTQCLCVCTGVYVPAASMCVYMPMCSVSMCGVCCTTVSVYPQCVHAWPAYACVPPTSLYKHTTLSHHLRLPLTPVTPPQEAWPALHPASGGSASPRCRCCCGMPHTTPASSRCRSPALSR